MEHSQQLIGSFTPAQMEERRKTLGASEIAAVCGIHPYHNALDVWLSKTGRAEIRERSAELDQYSKWGLRLEPVIAMAYADEHGCNLCLGEKTVHPTESWMSATPDRGVLRDHGKRFTDENLVDRGLELKNRNAHVADRFGESGTDLVTMDIAAQCHWSIEVTKLEVWDVAVLLGGNDFRWYRLHQDKDITDMLMTRGYAFWHKNVLADIPPAIDGSESWKTYITKTFAKYTDVMREGTSESFAHFTRLQEVKIEEKAVKSEKDLLENLLKAEVGDATGILWPNGAKFTWKKIADSMGVDYQSMAFELASRAGISMEDQKALAEKYTVVTKEGYRRIHSSLPKEKK